LELKEIQMPGFSQLAHRGNASDPKEDYVTYLYPNGSGIEGYVSEGGAFEDAITTYCDQLINEDVIEEYNVYKYEGYVNADFDGSRGSLRDNFNSWLKTNNQEYRGNHTLAHNYSKGSQAGAAKDYGSAFETWKTQVVGVKFGVLEFIKNIVIHELVHSVVDTTLSGVESKLGPDDSAHSLGTIYPQGPFSSPTSPCCTSYESTKAHVGSCSTAGGFTSYSMEITDCALDAIFRTKINSNI
jgi:hypothetical protein